jgi:hypothetical protein
MSKTKTKTRDFKPAENNIRTEALVEALVEVSSTLDDVVALVNELKSVHDAHCADTDAHTAADETNVTTLDDVANGVDTGNAGE